MNILKNPPVMIILTFWILFVLYFIIFGKSSEEPLVTISLRKTPVPPETCECDSSTYAELEDILRETEDIKQECLEALEICEKKEFNRSVHDMAEILEVKNNAAQRKKRK